MRTRSLAAAFAVVLLSCLLGAAQARAADPLPDPLATGPYAVTQLQQYKAGTVSLQEPNSAGGPATTNNSAATLQVRGSLTYPANRPTPAPLVVLVHGNHGSCRQTDGGAVSPTTTCGVFERNDLGYQYLASNLASWGYAVASIDQDELIYFQDSAAGKGMHQRRLLIAATLDAFYAANQAAIPDDADHNLGGSLVGKLDLGHIGLMGHSRGGDAVSSFIDFNRTRPAPGRRYNIDGVISVAPVDYERRAPYGTNYATLLPACDGDVSNLQGARFYERSQHAMPGDPFPKVQMYLLGANHNYFNSVWSADNDDSTVNDSACGPFAATQATSIRLSGGTTLGQSLVAGSRLSVLGTYSRANSTYPDQADTYASGDPALMGDQEKAGLALMSEFFRRYVGSETAFEPYMTGELSGTDLDASGTGRQLPASACPTSPTGTRISCQQRLQTAYFAGADERRDVIGPDADQPLALSAVGTSLQASGFDNPFTDDGGVSPKPATTASGADWCNPEPNQFTPSLTGIAGYPTAAKPCPLPAVGAVGGQASNRENSPVNHSYGLQLALAWDHPVQTTGEPAVLSTRLPAASGDISGLKALALGAAVNYFDPRNPPRTGDAVWDPSKTDQHFGIRLTDAEGHVATVDAGDRKYGTALQQSTGDQNARLHIVLNQVRVPLSDFAGVDLTEVRELALVFGDAGSSETGSVQIADVRFQEAAAPVAKPTPLSLVDATPRAAAGPADPDVVWVDGSAAGTTTPAGATAAAATPVVTASAAGTKVATTCARPTTTATARVVGGKLRVAGRASAAGCAGARVKAVQVTVATKVAGGWRVVGAKGRLGEAIAPPSGVGLVARGTSRWSLALARRLPASRYAVGVRVISTKGAVGRATAKAVRVR